MIGKHEGAWAQRLADTMRAELQAAADPLIEEAVEKFRSALRKRVAEMVLGLVEHSYSIDRAASELRITVRLAPPESRR